MNLQHQNNAIKLNNFIVNNDRDISKEIRTEHLFAHGTYTREVHIPAGVLAVGKLHKYSCINILLSGSCRIVSDIGEYEITAPFRFVSDAETRKIAYAITDCIFMNVHPWDGKMTLEEIEQELIIPDVKPSELTRGEQKCLG